MCPSDPQRAHHRQMQRHHLILTPAWPSRCPLRLLLVPCSAPVTSRLVTFYACSGLPVQRSWLYPGFDSCFPRVRTVFFLALPDPMCEEARALRELLCWRCWLRERVVLRLCNCCALVEAHEVNVWRQQRTSICSSKRQLAWLRPGVRLRKA